MAKQSQMKSYFMESKMTVIEKELKSGWAKRHYGRNADCIIAGVGQYMAALPVDTDSAPFKVLKMLQEVPILHFVVEHKRLSHREAKLRSLVLIDSMAQQLGEGFERRGSHLYYYANQLNVTYTRTTMRSTLIYVGIFSDCEDRDPDMMGLSHFDVVPQAFALKEMKRYRDDMASLTQPEGTQ